MSLTTGRNWGTNPNFQYQNPTLKVQQLHLSAVYNRNFKENGVAQTFRKWSRAATTSSLLSTWQPLCSFFIYGKSQQSKGAKSGEWGWCWMSSNPYSWMAAIATVALWAEALSWWKGTTLVIFSLKTSACDPTCVPGSSPTALPLHSMKRRSDLQTSLIWSHPWLRPAGKIPQDLLKKWQDSPLTRCAKSGPSELTR